MSSNIIELIKSAVRPIITIWGWIVIGVCIWNEIEVPAYLWGTLSALTAEYAGERAVKRIKETKEK